MELRKGTLLQGGKYKIEKSLGQGSFGITYLATAKFTTEGALGKMDVIAKVAIKEFFMSDVNARKVDGSTVDGSTGSVFVNYRRKFRKEAENLSRLSHSNIVKVFDVFDENGTSYYVMEFLSGQNLDEYIKSKGCLKEDEAIKIIRKVGSALSYMHSKKMLHLDIKPKNVMHSDDNSNYLIDFGLSKQYTEDGEPESSTSIGLGTPGYAPIEQSQYTQDGTFPATLDVYALGATLFKMLTGKRPPEATEILNSGFPYNELRDLGISEATITAIARSMNPIKNERWSTVAYFIDNLALYDTEHTEIEDDIRIDISTKRENKKGKDLRLVCSLASVWKSRNILTNITCIIGMLIVLLEINYISANTNFSSEITLFLGLMSVLAGIVSIMYGKKKFLYVPLFILPACGCLQLYSPGGCLNYLYQAVIISIGYAILIGSLYFKKDGYTAMSLLDKYENDNVKWNKIVTIVTYFLTSILLISIPCLFSNFHISYYRFGSLELLEILFCSTLILKKLRLGAYLIFVIVLIGYYIDWAMPLDDYYNYIVENCISTLFIVEIIVLFLIKKDGKTAWDVMK